MRQGTCITQAHLPIVITHGNYIFMSCISSWINSFRNHSCYWDLNATILLFLLLLAPIKRDVENIIRVIYCVDVNARAALKRCKESFCHGVEKPGCQSVELFADGRNSTACVWWCCHFFGLGVRIGVCRASEIAQVGAAFWIAYWIHWSGMKRMVVSHTCRKWWERI